MPFSGKETYKTSISLSRRGSISPQIITDHLGNSLVATTTSTEELKNVESISEVIFPTPENLVYSYFGIVSKILKVFPNSGKKVPPLFQREGRVLIEFNEEAQNDLSFFEAISVSPSQLKLKTITVIDGEKIETHTLDRFNAPKFGINIDQQKRIQV